MADDLYDNEDYSPNNDEVVEALRDVEVAVGRVERTIENKFSFLNVIWAVLIVGFLWMVATDVWNSKWRLALVYGVDTEKIQMNNHPHDCNFLTAPIGNKYCHYDKNIETIRWATSESGAALVSYDGKTWSTFTPEPGTKIPKNPTVQLVIVSWQKIEE